MEEKLLSLLDNITHFFRFKMSKDSGQKRILLILEKEGVLTQRDLTKRLGFQSGSVSEILEKMENSGLIERLDSKTDKRTSDIFLTEKGSKIAKEAESEYQDELKRLFLEFSESDKRVFYQLLDQLWFNMKNLPPEKSHRERRQKNFGKHKKHHKGFHGHKKHHH